MCVCVFTIFYFYFVAARLYEYLHPGVGGVGGLPYEKVGDAIRLA